MNNVSLREMRKIRGLTLKQLEELTDISYVTISRIETGEQVPGEKLRQKLESELGTLDFTVTEKYKVRPSTKREVEKKIKEFITALLGLSDQDRKQSIKLMKNQLKRWF